MMGELDYNNIIITPQNVNHKDFLVIAYYSIN